MASQQPPVAAADVPPADAATTAQGRKRRHRARRSRAKRSTETPGGGLEEGNEGFSQSIPSEDDRNLIAEDRPLKPRHILDRSASIARREDDLARALVITMIKGHEVGAVELVRTTIANRFEIKEESLILRPWGSTSFLLILPTDAMLKRVYNGGRPIITPSARLHVMQWTRFLQSSAASLPLAIEVEIRGIPAHAWELPTAELLLNEYCWIVGLHPSIAERRDIYQKKAWCSNPNYFPVEMDLEIVEPPLAAEH
ncbi:hypothetical protein SETIT_9G265700v2 [Setaria italica]|uniref:DUF4283 domain-containing protein n=1 Tax=Setaria italica TaxID=4555 RepID=A0A368SKV6_SETIT|nr:hypothetical protein SETIT_9G265700v2 [Setaria italica]